MSSSKDISLKYIDYIRSQDQCCVCLEYGQTEPHHLVSVGMVRNRKKPMGEHFSAVPVCRECHQNYHNIGLKAFEEQWNQNMFRTNHKYLVLFLQIIRNDYDESS